jgi:hypothetical protein
LIYLNIRTSNRDFSFLLACILIAIHQEARNMRDFRNVITSAFLAFAAWTATVNPSQADSGIVHVLFSTAGIVAGVGNGEGTLTFHGKTYPFEVSAASVGPEFANPR